MFGMAGEGRRGTLVLATVKTVAAIGLLSWFASLWLAGRHDPDTLKRLAGNISRGVDDPLTTGSVASRVAAVDPCAMPNRR